MMAAFLMPATSAESGDLLVDVEDVIIAARAYDNGNYQIAIETRTSAVERENTDAMTLLSELHLSGQAGRPGTGKAAYRYRWAACAGDISTQLTLVDMLPNGCGVK